MCYESIDKFWSNHPNIYVLTDNNAINYDSGINYLCIKDKGFSSNLLSIIDMFKYIYLWLDDFILLEKVNNAYMEEAENIIKNHKDIGCIRLLYKKSWTLNEYINSKLFGILDKSVKYYSSCQISLFNSQYLSKILKKGESAWEFEINGSKRAKKIKENVLCVANKKKPLHYANILRGGKINEKDIPRCKKIGFNIEYLNFKVSDNKPKICKEKLK